MRMWMLPPHLLCRQHLLGEHRELHALATLLAGKTKKKSIAGHLAKGQLEPQNLQTRHEDTEQEMKRRGYKAGSPLNTYPEVPPELHGQVDRFMSRHTLNQRCPECYKLYIVHLGFRFMAYGATPLTPQANNK